MVWCKLPGVKFLRAVLRSRVIFRIKVGNAWMWMYLYRFIESRRVLRPFNDNSRPISWVPLLAGRQYYLAIAYAWVYCKSSATSIFRHPPPFKRVSATATSSNDTPYYTLRVMKYALPMPIIHILQLPTNATKTARQFYNIYDRLVLTLANFLEDHISKIFRMDLCSLLVL